MIISFIYVHQRSIIFFIEHGVTRIKQINTNHKVRENQLNSRLSAFYSSLNNLQDRSDVFINIVVVEHARPLLLIEQEETPIELSYTI